LEVVVGTEIGREEVEAAGGGGGENQVAEHRLGRQAHPSSPRRDHGRLGWGGRTGHRRHPQTRRAAGLEKMPSGRAMSATISRANAPSGSRLDPRYPPTKEMHSPVIRPPTSAPIGLSNPPTTAAVNP